MRVIENDALAVQLPRLGLAPFEIDGRAIVDRQRQLGTADLAAFISRQSASADRHSLAPDAVCLPDFEIARDWCGEVDQRRPGPLPLSRRSRRDSFIRCCHTDVGLALRA